MQIFLFIISCIIFTTILAILLLPIYIVVSVIGYIRWDLLKKIYIEWFKL